VFVQIQHRRRNLILGVCAAVLAAGLVAGGVLASQFQGLDDPAELAAAMQDAPVVRVADIGASSGFPARGVFVQFTANGQFCVFEAPSATSLDRRGGCNSVDDPLGGSTLSASLSYEGGPQTSRVSDARLIGLVATGVAAVQIAMSDGSRRTVPLRRPTAVALSGESFRAFGYRFDPADMRGGREPIAVIALDSGGKEIGRQTTGFGG
jgi:hypothetical protein